MKIVSTRQHSSRMCTTCFLWPPLYFSTSKGIGKITRCQKQGGGPMTGIQERYGLGSCLVSRKEGEGKGGEARGIDPNVSWAIVTRELPTPWTEWQMTNTWENIPSRNLRAVNIMQIPIEYIDLIWCTTNATGFSMISNTGLLIFVDIFKVNWQELKENRSVKSRKYLACNNWLFGIQRNISI